MKKLRIVSLLIAVSFLCLNMVQTQPPPIYQSELEHLWRANDWNSRGSSVSFGDTEKNSLYFKKIGAYDAWDSILENVNNNNDYTGLKEALEAVGIGFIDYFYYATSLLRAINGQSESDFKFLRGNFPIDIQNTLQGVLPHALGSLGIALAKGGHTINITKLTDLSSAENKQIFYKSGIGINWYAKAVLPSEEVFPILTGINQNNLASNVDRLHMIASSHLKEQHGIIHNYATTLTKEVFEKGDLARSSGVGFDTAFKTVYEQMVKPIINGEKGVHPFNKLFVIVAGNDGLNLNTAGDTSILKSQLVNFHNIIFVGGTNKDHSAIVNFPSNSRTRVQSNYGDVVELYAPAQDVEVFTYKNAAGTDVDESSNWYGTSAAAPMVSATAGLVAGIIYHKIKKLGGVYASMGIEKLNMAKIKQLLIDSGDTLTDPNNKQVKKLNVKKAVENAFLLNIEADSVDEYVYSPTLKLKWSIYPNSFEAGKEVVFDINNNSDGGIKDLINKNNLSIGLNSANKMKEVLRNLGDYSKLNNMNNIVIKDGSNTIIPKSISVDSDKIKVALPVLKEGNYTIEFYSFAYKPGEWIIPADYLAEGNNDAIKFTVGKVSTPAQPQQTGNNSTPVEGSNIYPRVKRVVGQRQVASGNTYTAKFKLADSIGEKSTYLWQFDKLPAFIEKIVIQEESELKKTEDDKGPDVPMRGRGVHAVATINLGGSSNSGESDPSRKVVAKSNQIVCLIGKPDSDDIGDHTYKVWALDEEAQGDSARAKKIKDDYSLKVDFEVTKGCFGGVSVNSNSSGYVAALMAIMAMLLLMGRKT